MFKKLKIFLLIFLLTFFVPKDSFSIPVSVPLPGVATPGQTITEFKLCQIRRFFCGSTAVVLVAMSIFILGLMTLNGKLHWATAIMIIAGIFVFLNANAVATAFADIGFVILIQNPLCECECGIDFTGLDFNQLLDGLKSCVSGWTTIWDF